MSYSNCEEHKKLTPENDKKVFSEPPHLLPTPNTN